MAMCEAIFFPSDIQMKFFSLKTCSINADLFVCIHMVSGKCKAAITQLSFFVS
jgi:hypothetical protein